LSLFDHSSKRLRSGDGGKRIGRNTKSAHDRDRRTQRQRLAVGEGKGRILDD
jgi:hypothetical protein